MKGLPLPYAGVLLCCGCGGQLGPDGDAAVDGAVDVVADASDAGSSDGVSQDVELPDGFDTESCVGDSVGFSNGCNATNEQYCQTWTRDRAFGAYGHTTCQAGTCTLGDYCPSASTLCQCSPTLICAPGQVCYSDTPTGPTHCKAACTPSP